jgi:hypothetical protein
LVRHLTNLLGHQRSLRRRPGSMNSAASCSTPMRSGASTRTTSSTSTPSSVRRSFESWWLWEDAIIGARLSVRWSPSLSPHVSGGCERGNRLGAKATAVEARGLIQEIRHDGEEAFARSAEHRMPAPGKTRCREFGSVHAAVSVKPGGVMASSAPPTNNTEASLRAGAVRPGLPLGTFQAAQSVNT